MDPKYCPYSSKRVEAIVPCRAVVTRSTDTSNVSQLVAQAGATLRFEGYLLLNKLVPCAVPEKLYP